MPKNIPLEKMAPQEKMDNKEVIYQSKNESPALDKQSSTLAKNPLIQLVATGAAIVVMTPVLVSEIAPSAVNVAKTVLNLKEVANATVIAAQTPLGIVVQGFAVETILKKDAPPSTGALNADEVLPKSGAYLKMLLIFLIPKIITRKRMINLKTNIEN